MPFAPGRVLPANMDALQWGEFLERFARYVKTIEEASAADIADVTATVNVAGKYEGKLVWDSTNASLYRAAGSAAADDWELVDGSAAVTPS